MLKAIALDEVHGINGGGVGSLIVDVAKIVFEGVTGFATRATTTSVLGATIGLTGDSQQVPQTSGPSSGGGNGGGGLYYSS